MSAKEIAKAAPIFVLKASLDFATLGLFTRAKDPDDPFERILAMGDEGMEKNEDALAAKRLATRLEDRRAGRPAVINAFGGIRKGWLVQIRDEVMESGVVYCVLKDTGELHVFENDVVRSSKQTHFPCAWQH